jgi:hypothetical protein
VRGVRPRLVVRSERCVHRRPTQRHQVPRHRATNAAPPRQRGNGEYLVACDAGLPRARELMNSADGAAKESCDLRRRQERRARSCHGVFCTTEATVMLGSLSGRLRLAERALSRLTELRVLERRRPSVISLRAIRQAGGHWFEPSTAHRFLCKTARCVAQSADEIR